MTKKNLYKVLNVKSTFYMVIIVFIFLLLYFKRQLHAVNMGIGLISNFRQMARSEYFLELQLRSVFASLFYHYSLFT